MSHCAPEGQRMVSESEIPTLTALSRHHADALTAFLVKKAREFRS